MYPVQKGLTSKFGTAAKAKLGKIWGKNVILWASMFVTWFGIGFWHGGSWKYICSSGLFFFVMIVGGILLQPFFDMLKKITRVNTNAWSWHLLESVRTFSLFTLSVSFGRAQSLEDGFSFWRTGLTNIQGNVNSVFTAVLNLSITEKIGIDLPDLCVLIISLLTLLLVSTLQLNTENGGLRERLAHQNLPFRWALYIVMIFAVVVFGMYGPGYNPADFIYERF
jgi:small-conductance mechanosensitive channel